MIKEIKINFLRIRTDQFSYSLEIDFTRICHYIEDPNLDFTSILDVLNKAKLEDNNSFDFTKSSVIYVDSRSKIKKRELDTFLKENYPHISRTTKIEDSDVIFSFKNSYWRKDFIDCDTSSYVISNKKNSYNNKYYIYKCKEIYVALSRFDLDRINELNKNKKVTGDFNPDEFQIFDKEISELSYKEIEKQLKYYNYIIQGKKLYEDTVLSEIMFRKEQDLKETLSEEEINNIIELMNSNSMELGFTMLDSFNLNILLPKLISTYYLNMNYEGKKMFYKYLKKNPKWASYVDYPSHANRLYAEYRRVMRSIVRTYEKFGMELETINIDLNDFKTKRS